MDTTWIPDSVWQLPLPLLLIALLSLGIFVTKREHANMTKMMEYFRDLVGQKDTIIQDKDHTIANQAEALKTLNDIAPLIADVLTTIRKIAREGRE